MQETDAADEKEAPEELLTDEAAGPVEPEPPEAEPGDLQVPSTSLDIDPAKMPVRMLPISAEELEHAEDKKLDAEFELRLQKEGDDLLPVKNGEALLEQFAVRPEDADPTENSSETKQQGGNRAVDIAIGLSYREPEANFEKPVLPDNPTEEDLIEFASRHPAVRHITSLFRGEVRAVRKK